MKELEQRDWLIALHGLNGMGRKTLMKLHEYIEGDYTSLSSISLEDVKTYISARNSEKTFRMLKDEGNEDYVRKCKQSLHSQGIQCITWLDDNYPILLRETHDPPLVLYCKGHIELIDSFTLTVVGTRNPTSYGKAVTKKIVESLISGGASIVSGLARGIDSIAHQTCLSSAGSTIAVLGCGIDVIYPPENKELYRQIAEKGLVISEYCPGTPPNPGLFPERNRIISGLSYGTVVIEANARSGSLITADQAMEQGRDVFAVPGPISSPKSDGPNMLIQQGAKLILNGEQILEEYPEQRINIIDKIERHQETLTPEEACCIEILKDEPLHIETIIHQLDMPAPKVQSLLLALQLRKRVTQLPGQVYRLNL